MKWSQTQNVRNPQDRQTSSHGFDNMLELPAAKISTEMSLLGLDRPLQPSSQGLSGAPGVRPTRSSHCEYWGSSEAAGGAVVGAGQDVFDKMGLHQISPREPSLTLVLPQILG